MAQKMKESIIEALVLFSRDSKTTIRQSAIAIRAIVDLLATISLDEQTRVWSEVSK